MALRRLASTLISHYELAIIALVPPVLFWRLFLEGQVLFWGVPLLQFYPWRRLAVEAIRAGHLPLWAHGLGNGAPLVANLQSALFYPLNVIYLVFPVEQAMGYSAVLHLALAGLFMHSYGRAVGLGRLASTIAALSYMLSGFLVGRGQFLSMVNAAAWLPLLFLLAERLSQRRRWPDAAALGLALGLQLLAGHAQLWYYGLWGLGPYLLWRAASLPPGSDRRAGRVALALGLLALAVLIAVGLAAVQIGPTLELSLQSQRAGGADWDFAMTYSFWPWRLVTLFAPDFFGNPAHGDYWGYANYWEDAAYVGLLPIAFALVAALQALLSRIRRQPLPFVLTPFYVLLAVVSILLAMGQNTPLYPLVFRFVPGFGMFQAPARLLYLYTFSAAILAGAGVETFRAGERSRFVCRLAVAGALSALAVTLAAQYLIIPGAAPPGVKLTFVGASGRFALLAAIVALLLLKRDAGKWERAWAVAATAFVAADLLWFCWPLNPTVDPALYRSPTRSGAFLRQDAGGYFRLHVPEKFDYDAKFHRYLEFSDFGPSDLGHWLGLRELLLPNLAVCEGLDSADNYEPLLVGRYAEMTDYLAKAPPEETLRLLRLMNVGYVVGEPYLPGQTPVFSDTVAIYRLEDRLPRAYFVPSARVIEDDRQLLAVLSGPSFDPRREVLLEPPERPAEQPDCQSQAAISLHYRPNGVTINATAPCTGYLVIGHTYYPGWQAAVDGRATGILRANFAFQAVALPEGEHVVSLDFVSPSFWLGLAVSLCTLALLGIGLARAHFERKGKDSLPDEELCHCPDLQRGGKPGAAGGTDIGPAAGASRDRR